MSQAWPEPIAAALALAGVHVVVPALPEGGVRAAARALRRV